jgi:hypothetical protein
MRKKTKASPAEKISAGTLAIAIMFSLSATAVQAADRDVPRSMLALRDSLLRQRDYLLQRRSQCDYNLRNAEYVLKDLQMRVDSCDLEVREQIADSAFRMRYSVNMMYRERDNIGKDLLNNDDDLRQVESDIKYYAGL